METRHGAVEADPLQQRAADERAKRRGNGLTYSGYGQDVALKRNHECGGGDRGPHARAVEQDRRERDAIGRPDGAKIAASDFSGGLAEFAGDVVGDEDDRGRDEISAESIARSMIRSLRHFVQRSRSTCWILP